MTKEEAIKEIEKLQIDIKDDGKITLIKIHFDASVSKDYMGRVCKRFIDILEKKFPDYKNYILIPERDDEYEISTIEITKNTSLDNLI